MKPLLLSLTLALGLLLAAGPLTGSAAACPLCKVANESKDDATPKAYMISILFMLAVPATLFTGFGIGFYRLARKEQAYAEAVGPTIAGGDTAIGGRGASAPDEMP